VHPHRRKAVAAITKIQEQKKSDSLKAVVESPEEIQEATGYHNWNLFSLLLDLQHWHCISLQLVLKRAVLLY
jgi:hypothetical protein